MLFSKSCACLVWAFLSGAFASSSSSSDKCHWDYSKSGTDWPSINASCGYQCGVSQQTRDPINLELHARLLVRTDHHTRKIALAQAAGASARQQGKAVAVHADFLTLGDVPSRNQDRGWTTVVDDVQVRHVAFVRPATGTVEQCAQCQEQTR